MRALKPALVLSLALSAGACSAKSPQGPQVFSWMLADPVPVPVRTAAAAPVELEDDGLPAQAAPSYRIRQSPDDPTAPWSRNYGGPAAIRAEDAGPQAPMAAGAAWGQDGETGDQDPLPVAADEGDGFPAVMGPEEAGVPVAPPEGRRMQRGAALTLPSARCAPSGNGWICTR